ncbi:MAG: glycosyltransferase [Verrucomicrobia bacterium]|nr:glycosyltransferase [Verrucomicrobiota bacterium]
MARIAIYIGRHLCTAPRPCKEADALAAAGHEVTVSGLWFDPRLVARDRALLAGRPWKFVPYADCRPDTPMGRWRWQLVRIEQRFSRLLFARTGRVSANLFGYGTSRMLRHARRHAAELSLFHSEGGLWVARALHRAGRPVGVDFEDWFSRDLPPESRAGRPLQALEELERAALHYGPYVLATSRAMARALATDYAGPEPTVIYNAFPATEATGPVPHTGSAPIRLHWFSQTLGPGRGLETLFAALPRLSSAWELHLLADDPQNFSATLLATLPEGLRPRVRIEATVPNAELPARIAENDIGLALDVSDIPSRNLTVTNKLFQYLDAGLAVAVSDTAGHTEILGQAPAMGGIFTAGDAPSLAAALNRLMADRSRLAAARTAAFAAARTLFSHERQIPVYADLAARALRPN